DHARGGGAARRAGPAGDGDPAVRLRQRRGRQRLPAAQLPEAQGRLHGHARQRHGRRLVARGGGGLDTDRGRRRARAGASARLRRRRRQRDPLGLHPHAIRLGGRHRDRAAPGRARPGLRGAHEPAGPQPGQLGLALRRGGPDAGAPPAAARDHRRLGADSPQAGAGPPHRRDAVTRPPLRSRALRTSVAAALILAAVAAWWLVAVWKPAPPRELKMATGPAGSAYAEYGARYRERLARSGIQLTLVPTEGAVANLALLRDAVSGVGAGFVQAGTTTAAESPGLVSLGTVFYEPLWLFERGLDPKAGFAALAGRRISIGREGSGTRALALRILDLGGVGAGVAELMALSPEQAADRL